MSPLKLICTMLLAASVGLCLPAAGSGSQERSPRCGEVFQSPGEATEHQLRTSVLCLVNAARQRNGIAPLEFNLALRKSAEAHSLTMVRSGSLSHYGPSGSTPTTRVAHSGYLARMSSFRVAENIGAGRGREYGSPMSIVRMWMGSSPHRQNILDSGLRDFGVGVSYGDPLGGGRDAATYTLVFGVRSR
ncbi:MAG TPA: CAP domain-containing protein [Solirubrobacterales bacterium]|nr:CAP domain-containing protein [Solirubrobacterales bacterium]